MPHTCMRTWAYTVLAGLGLCAAGAAMVIITTCTSPGGGFCIFRSVFGWGAIIFGMAQILAGIVQAVRQK